MVLEGCVVDEPLTILGAMVMGTMAFCVGAGVRGDDIV